MMMMMRMITICQLSLLLTYLPLSTILDSLRELMCAMNEEVGSRYLGLLLRSPDSSGDIIASIASESIESRWMDEWWMVHSSCS